jgi:hypothetical protein
MSIIDKKVLDDLDAWHKSIQVEHSKRGMFTRGLGDVMAFLSMVIIVGGILTLLYTII